MRPSTPARSAASSPASSTDANAGKPLMHEYYADYFDLYWDLHLGVTGEAIPAEVRQIGTSFTTVLGHWFPTSDIVHENFMRVRELRPRAQGMDRRPGAGGASTARSRTRRRRSSTTGSRTAGRRALPPQGHRLRVLPQLPGLRPVGQHDLQGHGRAGRRRTATRPSGRWFARTMATSGQADGGAFTPLDRFVMELFRTISPNAGSLSPWRRTRGLASSRRQRRHPAPADEPGPSALAQPGRSSTRTATWRRRRRVDNDEAQAQEVGLARCPFPPAPFAVNDGRQAELTNSAFGAVYGVVDGTPHPVCDTAGYAPFGFGYRRCGGEQFTVEFIKEFLRTVRRTASSSSGSTWTTPSGCRCPRAASSTTTSVSTGRPDPRGSGPDGHRPGAAVRTP